MADLRIEHDKFLTEYLKTGNGKRSYMLAYPDCKPTTAERGASALMRKPEVAAELERRRSDVAARNGITLDAIVSRLKVQAFTDLTKLSGPPSTWPPELAAAAKDYQEAGRVSGAKIGLWDQPKLLTELWDRLYPESGKPPAPPPGSVTNVQINVDKMLLTLQEASGASLPAQ